MALIKYSDLNTPIFDFHDKLSRIFSDDRELFDRTSTANSDWVPRVDIKEQDKQYVILGDFPGIDPKDIKIAIDNNTLTISGERSSENKQESENYSRIERFQGKFSRQFTLPNEVDMDNIKAKGKNGVLEINIPKSKGRSSKFIEVIAE